MNPRDKFGKEIYRSVFQRLLAVGQNLERIGFKESSTESNLFYRKDGDGIVFADMRGTKELPIWENPMPLIYFGKEEIWRRTRHRNSMIKELSMEQIPYRFSFYSGSSASELVESGDVYRLDAIHRETFADNLFKVFFEVYDDPPDGYCKTCKNDIQKDLYFCSKECENEGGNKVFLRLVEMAPECSICRIRELPHHCPEFEEYLRKNGIEYVKRLLTHHISYPVGTSVERTMRICPRCHSRIHNSDAPKLRDLRPPVGDSREFYKRNTHNAKPVAFCGWCGHDWKTRTEHPVRCPKCKSEYVSTGNSDIACIHCKEIYPSLAEWRQHLEEVRMIRENTLREKRSRNEKRDSRLLREGEMATARKFGLR